MGSLRHFLFWMLIAAAGGALTGALSGIWDWSPTLTFTVAFAATVVIGLTATREAVFAPVAKPAADRITQAWRRRP